jgi:hypothetical protein
MWSDEKDGKNLPFGLTGVAETYAFFDISAEKAANLIFLIPLSPIKFISNVSPPIHVQNHARL